ncbi:hypothetical protein [Rhodopirellula bahusiensis]|uniref:Uncharacterized protein n=1 Tax=Rhodopirellula bahusiensis TaxID=2014065 RepID=A0A2G1W3W7_9BACT|nr:hypothetical protein [Rhodopirellula bahusiensis]PHQ33738.1 hypothetical protein CEE69_19455 [Rhodopirellula bahusiensis]
MKKFTSLALLGSALLLSTGCGRPDSALVTPDAEFYAKGLEAEKNGLPPGTVAPQKGKLQPEPPVAAPSTP